MSTATIATLGSHSCLQILKGAKEEGFKTLAVVLPRTEKFYRGFSCIDEIIKIHFWSAFPKIEKKLLKKNAILIPHGSFVAYLGENINKNFKVSYFGNRKVLGWEGDRRKQRKWLEAAKINVPREFGRGEKIDRPVIVKFYGAQGGKEYFMTHSQEEFQRKIKDFKGRKFIVQEYVIGNPIYIHYFHSLLSGETEIMSVDKRYETNADSLGRLPLKGQKDIEIEPSFVVVGNIPLALRESMLVEALDMGERLVAASKKLIDKRGIWGPFCLETVVTPDQKFYVIEISCRIVAGTNIFVPYSPYTYFKYGEPMSTGRRIAKEIKLALGQNKLKSVLG